MAVNTWDGAVDTDWNREVNWNTTGETDRVPTGADDVVIANVTNDPVIPSSTDPTINSLAIESGGNLDGNGNEITIDGENGAGLAVDLDGIITGTDTDITITLASAGTNVMFQPTTGALRNITINGSGNTVNLRNATAESNKEPHTWHVSPPPSSLDST